MPPGFDLADAVDEIDRPTRYTAARLGKLLRLTGVERLRLGITTIRAHDAATDAAVLEQRRERDRLRKVHQRASARAVKPKPLAQSKP